MSEQPELGQIVFGNPTGSYGTSEFADALVEAVLTEIERVYWNNNQENWDRLEDPEMEGLEFRPYCWDEESPEAVKPNLKFDFSPQEIRWYKRPHRGQTCTIEWDEKQWREWFDTAMNTVRSNDSDIEEVGK